MPPIQGLDFTSTWADLLHEEFFREPIISKMLREEQSFNSKTKQNKMKNWFKRYLGISDVTTIGTTTFGLYHYKNTTKGIETELREVNDSIRELRQNIDYLEKYFNIELIKTTIENKSRGYGDTAETKYVKRKKSK